MGLPGSLNKLKEWINEPLQQKINESIKDMVFARAKFTEDNSENFNFNNTHADNIKLLNKAIREINDALYVQLNMHRNDPNFKEIAVNLEQVKDKMVLCENFLYEFREQGIEFPQEKKSQLYNLEAELSDFGAARIKQLKDMDAVLDNMRKAQVKEALKNREIKQQEAFDLNEYHKRVEVIDNDIKELVEDANIPIRGRSDRSQKTKIPQKGEAR